MEEVHCRFTFYSFTLYFIGSLWLIEQSIYMDVTVTLPSLIVQNYKYIYG